MSNVLTKEQVFRTADHQQTGRGRVWSTVLVVLAVIAFAALALAAHNTPYFDFDLTITRAVQAVQSSAWMTFLALIGLPGYPPQVYVLVVALLLALWFGGARWEAVAVLFANLGVGSLGTGVKMLVARMRPSPELVNVSNPALDGGGLSFPAGHVLVYVSVLGFLMVLLWRVRRRAGWQNALLILFGVMIALIGVSRIASGEHWFSDVVGGYLFGFIGLWLTVRFYDWGKPRFFVKRMSDQVLQTERE